MNEPDKGYIKAALAGLEKNPPVGDIKPLTGQKGYRLRVGHYRILFHIEENVIVVTNIEPRGQAYKKKNKRTK
jgi:mRNA interferase RelE/StbE